MPSKRRAVASSSGAFQPASSGSGARHASQPASSGSGASQPASLASSYAQSATASNSYQAPQQDFAAEWARVRSFGRFPNRILYPQTAAEQEEADLWAHLYLQKSMGMPDEVWNELCRYGAPRPVDPREVVIAELEAFVKEFRRLPKQGSPGTEEDVLARRLIFHRKRFDDAQLLQYLALQVQCDDAAQDRKRKAWRMLLDEVIHFVRDSRRWPCRSQTHIKEDLLAERLKKAKKEFDEAHLTELQNLQQACQQDAAQKEVDDLVKEVTELGHWPPHDFNKVTAAALQTVRFDELDCRPLNSTLWSTNRPILCFGVQTVKFNDLECRPSNSTIWSADR